MERREVRNKACLKNPDYINWFSVVYVELKKRKLTKIKLASELNMDYFRLCAVIRGEVSTKGEDDDVAKINEYLGINAIGRKIIDK